MPERQTEETPGNTVWSALHKIGDRVTVLEVQTESTRQASQAAVAALIQRQDKHEERFDTTLTKLTDAISSIDRKLGIYIAGASAQTKTAGIAITYIIAAATPVLGLLAYLVNFYVNHT